MTSSGDTPDARIATNFASLAAIGLPRGNIPPAKPAEFTARA